MGLSFTSSTNSNIINECRMSTLPFPTAIHPSPVQKEQPKTRISQLLPTSQAAAWASDVQPAYI